MTSLGGAYSLSMNGAGTLVLSNANTYSGGTTIGGGTLKLGNASALGTAITNTINTGGVLDVNGMTLPYVLDVEPTFTNLNTILLNNNSILANNSATKAAVKEQVWNPTSSVGINIGGTGPMEIDNLEGPGYPNWNTTNVNTSTVDLGGTNDNVGVIVINAAGTLLLNKTNTYTSAASINTGVHVAKLRPDSWGNRGGSPARVERRSTSETRGLTLSAHRILRAGYLISMAVLNC